MGKIKVGLPLALELNFHDDDVLSGVIVDQLLYPANGCVECSNECKIYSPVTEAEVFCIKYKKKTV